MKKSEGELLREYAQIISEAQGDTWPEEYDPDNDELAMDDKRIADSELDNFDPENNEIDLPDDSMMDDENGDIMAPTSDIDDPINDLANELHIDANKISQWLKVNDYELTPIGGLSNKQGKV